MEKDDIRTFVFESEALAIDAVEKINAKFPRIAHVHDKKPKFVCTIQPESLTDLVCEFVEEELGGKMKGFSLSWV
jgi:hypothetical protein